MAESLAVPRHKDTGIQGRHHSHPPVCCRDLGSLSEADQATGVVSPALLVPHPWHQMARPRVEKRSPLESQPDQHRVYLASGAAALGWSHHKDGRYTLARLWCSKKALQRSAEETACTGGSQPQSWQQEASGQDSWFSPVRKASCKFEAERNEATKLLEWFHQRCLCPILGIKWQDHMLKKEVL